MKVNTWGKVNAWLSEPIVDQRGLVGAGRIHNPREILNRKLIQQDQDLIEIITMLTMSKLL